MIFYPPGIKRDIALMQADAVHFNTACKTVIGNMVYAKMVDLNIV